MSIFGSNGELSDPDDLDTWIACRPMVDRSHSQPLVGRSSCTIWRHWAAGRTDCGRPRDGKLRCWRGLPQVRQLLDQARSRTSWRRMTRSWVRAFVVRDSRRSDVPRLERMSAWLPSRAC
jgi:hypothetical protein